MDRVPPPLPPSVIEGVLEVTTVYTITLVTRIRSRPSALCPSCQTAAAQEARQAKTRPVATVRPLPAAKEGEAQQQESDFPEIFGKEGEFPETLGKEEPGFADQWGENEEVCNEKTDEKNNESHFSGQNEDKEEVYSENTNENDSGCLVIGQSDSSGASEFDQLWESRKDKRETQPPTQQDSEPASLPLKPSPKPPLTQPPQPSTEAKPAGQERETQPPPQQNSQPSLPPQTSPTRPLTQPPQPSTEAKPAGREKSPGQELRDPCSCHRDRIRAVFGKGNLAPERMEDCQNGDCQEGPGCAEEYGSDLKGNQFKETCLTECLDEFLEELQLTHLGNYLRVLGCTCVRDLRLLEEPELNAIQLISRRRLLKRLESLSLHHEAPPADCSLEGWLTWYGLTHIAGFLSAIGVHSVGDLGYLRDEDLELLKPVTRRRILSCSRK